MSVHRYNPFTAKMDCSGSPSSLPRTSFIPAGPDGPEEGDCDLTAVKVPGHHERGARPDYLGCAVISSFSLAMPMSLAYSLISILADKLGGGGIPFV
jgi:hypothetical protein